MVPGSRWRSGSGFWGETGRPGAFRMFPIDAVVMPFPSEVTTPPVTKTYLDKLDPLRFLQCYRARAAVKPPLEPRLERTQPRITRVIRGRARHRGRTSRVVRR